MSTFMEMLQAGWDQGKFVCVGLDSDLNHKDFPASVPAHAWADMWSEELDEAQLNQLRFNCHIVDSTKSLVLAYKPNLAFYRGYEGKRVLELTIHYIRIVAPDVLVILDAKQADIGNTNDGYVAEDFEYYGADAVTVHPYLGREAMKPFLDRGDKGIIVLCRTSNAGAGELQDLMVGVSPAVQDDLSTTCAEGEVRLYHFIAYMVSQAWNRQNNCALVVGATYPEELEDVRRIVGNMPILIPGIGAQGGDLEKTVLAGRDRQNQGMIINSSRGIIFASSGEDFAEAARAETLKLHDAITTVLAA